MVGELHGRTCVCVRVRVCVKFDNSMIGKDVPGSMSVLFEYVILPFAWKD